MSETLNAQDIAKKLQEQRTSLSATLDTHEVSTGDEVGDGIAGRFHASASVCAPSAGVQ